MPLRAPIGYHATFPYHPHPCQKMTHPPTSPRILRSNSSHSHGPIKVVRLNTTDSSLCIYAMQYRVLFWKKGKRLALRHCSSEQPPDNQEKSKRFEKARESNLRLEWCELSRVESITVESRSVHLDRPYPKDRRGKKQVATARATPYAGQYETGLPC